METIPYMLYNYGSSARRIHPQSAVGTVQPQCVSEKLHRHARDSTLAVAVLDGTSCTEYAVGGFTAPTAAPSAPEMC